MLKPWLSKLAALAVMAVAVLALAAPRIAHAQPAAPGTIRVVPAPGQPPSQPAAQAPAAADDSEHAVIAAPTDATDHKDRVEGNSAGMAILFWIFAAASIAGALFVISRRNLIAAVMGMVGSFIGIAAVYMMLYAHFLAVVQMLVYAGAIMVLFVFVIMILNRPEDEPVAPTGRAGQVIGGIAILYLTGRLALLLAHVHIGAASLAAPAQVTLTNGGEHADWGSVKAVGDNLFSGGIFPFEAISVLLLIAVVGAIAIAKPLKDSDDTQDLPAGGAS